MKRAFARGDGRRRARAGGDDGEGSATRWRAMSRALAASVRSRARSDAPPATGAAAWRGATGASSDARGGDDDVGRDARGGSSALWCREGRARGRSRASFPAAGSGRQDPGGRGPRPRRAPCARWVRDDR